MNSHKKIVDLDNDIYYIGNNKKIIKPKRILAYERPDLLSEWDFEKNKDICNPYDVTVGSNKYAYWKCKLGHEWRSKISNRTSGFGCPYCAGKKVLKGYNDLATIHPSLASEWHPTKNGNLTPETVTAGSHKYAYWKCNLGHEWRTQISNRTGSGTNCPICSKNLHTSFPEQAIYYYVKKVFPSAKNSFKDIFDNRMELDIYIPEIKIAIEYDGIAYHNSEKSTKRECEKYNICKNNGIKLIRIKEFIDEKTQNTDTCDDLIFTEVPKTSKKLDALIKNIFLLLGFQPPTVDTKKERFNIKEMYVSILKANSIAENFPELALEWHPTKNGNLTPQMFSPGSGEKIWWKCKKGHEYESYIFSRTKGVGCPYCTNKKVLKGYNDLATTHPSLASEWHPTRNGDLTPEMVTVGSSKKVWWICECGHEWKASIAKRSSGRNCPICTNKQVLSGHNDLATANPKLASEWHPIKNGTLTPEMVTISSGKKVWWKCKHGHEWNAIIASRSKGIGCPICANQQVLSGYNDLATINPELASEWHPTKNGDLTPEMVTTGSSKKVWWICKHGHEWKTNIAKRSSGGNCPICTNRQVLSGYNDLATVNPELASEWHPTKNKDLTPETVLPWSNKKAWWLCKSGHEWEARIYNRAKGNSCPFCNRHTKRVKCIETGEIFNSITLATQVMGVGANTLSSHLHGKYKSAGGYHWEFV